MADSISFAVRIHPGPRKPSSPVPSEDRCDLIADLARMSFSASALFICSGPRDLSPKGDDSSPSGVEASTNVPGSLPVAAISDTLRIRFPVLLSLTVPSVTMTSVAENASGGMPTS